MEEAVPRLLEILGPEPKKELRELKADDLILCHFGLAMYVRNEFGLWNDNKELMLSSGYLFDADGCSNEIVKRAWEKLQLADAAGREPDQ